MAEGVPRAMTKLSERSLSVFLSGEPDLYTARDVRAERGTNVYLHGSRKYTLTRQNLRG